MRWTGIVPISLKFHGGSLMKCGGLFRKMIARGRLTSSFPRT